MRFIHKIAVDHIGDGYSETYCGYAGSLFDDEFQDHCSNEGITCPDCLAEIEKDRQAREARRKK